MIDLFSTNELKLQKEQNYKTMAGLMNVAANAYSSNINALSGASAGQVARKNAYDQAQAAYKSNVYGTIGSLGSVAILAAFGI